MSYITLGNLTRFFDKLKDYLDGKYLKNGGTASSLNVKNLRMRTDIGSKDTPKITFTNNINSEIVSLYGLQSSVSGKSLIASIDGSNYSVLHTGNAYSYFPSKTGSGATGTWPINISGNALNDSEGNKIVDTYAKKSDIPTSSGFQNPATSDLDMNLHSITNFDQIYSDGGARIDIGDSRIQDMDDLGELQLANSTKVSIMTNDQSLDLREDGLYMNNSRIISNLGLIETSVKAYSVEATDSLTIPGGKIWIE